MTKELQLAPVLRAVASLGASLPRAKSTETCPQTGKPRKDALADTNWRSLRGAGRVGAAQVAHGETAGPPFTAAQLKSSRGRWLGRVGCTSLAPLSESRRRTCELAQSQTSNFRPSSCCPDGRANHTIGRPSAHGTTCSDGSDGPDGSGLGLFIHNNAPLFRSHAHMVSTYFVQVYLYSEQPHASAAFALTRMFLTTDPPPGILISA
jgi:hypothetical protein